MREIALSDKAVAIRTSIAMTTYNGASYIEEQLDSIFNQSRQPNEVIICDDCSTDNTPYLVEQYIRLNNLSNWHLVRNDRSLGWKKNFRKAIGLTSGDIVFFSDQDDIWLQNKIELMTDLMTQYDMGCLYGRYLTVDENGQLLHKRNSVENYSGRVTQVAFGPSFFTAGGLGCCMCVNKRVIRRYLNIGLMSDDHDSQCPRIALYYDTLWQIDKPVIKYRIHNGNTSNVSSERSYGASSLQHRIEDASVIAEWLKAIENDVSVDEQHLRYMHGALEVQQRRIDYLSGRNISFLSLIPYIRYYGNVTSFIGDLAYKHNVNDLFGKIRWRIETIRANNRLSK